MPCQAKCLQWPVVIDGTELCLVLCKVRAMNKLKSRLGIGQEDKYRHGHSGGVTGVISVEVPHWQRHVQRPQTAQIARLAGRPLPTLPTPFAAAQVPLPDDHEGTGGKMPLSRADSIPLGDTRTLANVDGDTSGKRSSVPLQRQSLVPGQTAVAGVSTRLGSAPPGLKPRLSLAGVAGGTGPIRHQSAPGLGKSFTCFTMTPENTHCKPWARALLCG